jgi:Flp pilus assembly protein CpaB
MRKIFLIIGAILGVIVAVGLFMFVQFSKPATVNVPVAIGNIPTGSVLKPYFFRVVKMSNIDQQTLSQWVTEADWVKLADGQVTNSDIHLGMPVARTQVVGDLTTSSEFRISTILTGTNDYYIVLPVKTDELGAYVQPYDRIDMIISLGSGGGALTLPPTRTNALGKTVDTGARLDITQTIQQPISKLVIQNMLILRIDRDKPSASAAQTDPANATGELKRLYLKVDRDQLEVLSFVLNNGKRNIAIRAANGSQESLPTDGVTWDDFVRWFYAQRNNDALGAKPFDVISPSEPK